MCPRLTFTCCLEGKSCSLERHRVSFFSRVDAAAQTSKKRTSCQIVASLLHVKDVRLLLRARGSIRQTALGDPAGRWLHTGCHDATSKHPSHRKNERRHPQPAIHDEFIHQLNFSTTEGWPFLTIYHIQLFFTRKSQKSFLEAHFPMP